MTQNNKVEEAVKALIKCILQDKNHQIEFASISSRTKKGYNRSMLMIKEHGPDIIKSILLQEEEGVDVDRSEAHEYHDRIWYRCPECDHPFVMNNSNFCAKCGTKLIWKGE